MRKLILAATSLAFSSAAFADGCDLVKQQVAAIKARDIPAQITQIAILADNVAVLAGTYIQIPEPTPRSNSLRYYYAADIDCFQLAAKELQIPLLYTPDTISLPSPSGATAGVTTDQILEKAGLLRLN